MNLVSQGLCHHSQIHRHLTYAFYLQFGKKSCFLSNQCLWVLIKYSKLKYIKLKYRVVQAAGQEKWLSSFFESAILCPVPSLELPHTGKVLTGWNKTSRSPLRCLGSGIHDEERLRELALFSLQERRLGADIFVVFFFAQRG